MLHLVKDYMPFPLVRNKAKISVLITYLNTSLKVLDNVVKPDINKRNMEWKARWTTVILCI